VSKLGKLALLLALFVPALAYAGIGIGINLGGPVVAPPPPGAVVNAPAGYWYQGYNGTTYGWWWVVGTTWYLYPAPTYPAPDPSQPPLTVANATPPGYQPGPYWYWCGQPAGYFPYVSQCQVPWQPVTGQQQAAPQEVAPQDATPQPEYAPVDPCSAPPPELPDYDQPEMPGDGYLWTPGYWACGDVGYYWVPGTWVQPPEVGLLWTPAYWGWSNGVYVFNAGYWGPHVGFYGGINYGFGYGGHGYEGGRWNNGVFAYNTAVNHFGGGVVVRNTYNETVINNPGPRVSFSGGANGVRAVPTPEEQAFARQSHVPPTAEQARHEQMAHADPAQRASVNGGRPTVAATARPGVLKGPGAMPGRAVNTYTPPRQNLPVNQPRPPAGGAPAPQMRPPAPPAGMPHPPAPAAHPPAPPPKGQPAQQHKPN
jgi:hypothetical protein